MSKLLFFKGLGGLYALSSPFFFGVGGYQLAPRNPIKNVEDVGHPIITNVKAKNNWEHKRIFNDSKFTVVVYGQGQWGEQNWNRYIEVKKNPQISDNRIFLFTGSPEYGTYGWPTYKFTFKSDVEEGRREYQGQCDINGREEDPAYLCSDNNLPDGWTKEKITT